MPQQPISNTPHTVKSFDSQLVRLHNLVAELGGMAERRFDQVVQALVLRDDQLADRMVNEDPQVEAISDEIDAQVIRVLALRSPVADDLRMVFSAIKISTALHRIAGLSSGIARSCVQLNTSPPIRSVHSLKRMGALVHHLLKEVLAAYGDRDTERALDVWRRDQEVDVQYSGLFRELLTYMLEDPHNITVCTQLMLIAKNIERIGDHATNVGEMVYYLVTGQNVDGQRPKDDTSSLMPGQDA